MHHDENGSSWYRPKNAQRLFTATPDGHEDRTYKGNRPAHKRVEKCSLRNLVAASCRANFFGFHTNTSIWKD